MRVIGRNGSLANLGSRFSLGQPRIRRQLELRDSDIKFTKREAGAQEHAADPHHTCFHTAGRPVVLLAGRHR